MTQDQYNILIKNGWKLLPNDNHMWMWGQEVIVSEEDAMNMADAYIGGLNVTDKLKGSNRDGNKGHNE